MQAAVLRAQRSRTGSLPRTVPLKVTRFWVICAFFLFWAMVIAARLFWLQILCHQEYVDRAERQQLRTFEVAPRRGILYDRNLRELAMTVQVDSFYAVPSEIEDKARVAHLLASVVHTDPDDAQTSEEQIANRMRASRGFAWIARRVTPELADKVRQLGLKGVYSQKEFQRFYPDLQIAAQVLGYVGVDDTGLGGLELKFESQLHGTSGRMFTAMDARRKVLGSTEREPLPGQNLVLTIDENIQFLAERALDHAMEHTHADNGTVVVQDVHTGQILALAIRPTFNPNEFRHTTTALLRNHAVSDVYEPGSTFKLVAYSAALDQGLTSPNDVVDCQGGSITIAGRVIHDNQGEHYGVIPVHKALEVSSDVGAIKMALKVGPDKFYNYVRAFGFGQKPGVELPGETRGLLRPVNKWGSSSIGSIAMGQEIGVTPVQLVGMVSTIANGGTYLPPRILQPGQFDAGNKGAAPQAAPLKLRQELPNPMPQGSHRVISEMAAAQMRKMLEGVVLYGTGKPAQLNGYSAGGKTGTAQKIDPLTHTYSKTMHIASFAGIAPVNNPAIAIAVVIDNPRGGSYYGTAVSAPVFAEVAQQVLEYLGVPHDEEVRPAKAVKQPEKPTHEDDHDVQDVEALYAAVNDLPSDDPLRAQPAQPAAEPKAAKADTRAPAAAPVMSATATVAQSGKAAPGLTVVMNAEKKVQVPSLIGMPMRKVIETIGSSGLQVQIAGTGSVREQAPAAGTLVSPGTRIVVRGSH